MNYPNPYEVPAPPLYKDNKLFKSLDISVIDVETTGLDPLNDRIISIGIYRCTHGETKEPLYIEINPEMVIAPHITALTGISNHSLKLKNAPTLDCVLDEIYNYIGDSICVAHNAQFDRAFVNPAIFFENGYTQNKWLATPEESILMQQFNGKGRKWLCTYRLAWHAFLAHFKYEQIVLKNEALRCWLEPTYIPDGKAHNAEYDAKTTLRLFQHICSYVEYNMGVKTLDDLFKLNDSIKGYTIMPFGEYKGQEIEKVPNDYIEFGLRNFETMDYELGIVLQNELNRRKEQGINFTRPIVANSVAGASLVGMLGSQSQEPREEKKCLADKPIKEMTAKEINQVLAKTELKYQQGQKPPKTTKPKPFQMF